MEKLSREEKERWKRQLNIPQFGMKSQIRLKESKVVLFGVGGVGCSTALYLVAAGVGQLVMVDYDKVALHNLNRQILYGEADLGKNKVEVAAKRLHQLNSRTKFITIKEKVDKEKIAGIVQGVSFVVDTFDRNADRLAVNKSCIDYGIPAAHGFVQDFSGEVFAVLPGKSPCLHCVIDETFPEMEETPVIGVVAGLIGIQLAAIALKYLTQCGNIKAGFRLIWDMALDQFYNIPLIRQLRCPTCS